MQSPIFIFSLPRSGSTLLQRVLMTHREICSVAEPWLILPQIYITNKKAGVLTEYSHLTAYQGIEDFIKNLPLGIDDYNNSLSKFIIDLYKKQCRNGETYFLDKTPRYYLIIDEIVNLFPNAKYIFLFRNPISIYASVISTWGANRLNKLHRNDIDFKLGFNMLSEGFLKHKDKSIKINYEEFVNNPSLELDKISKYLELESGGFSLNQLSLQSTNGALGDSTGVKSYSTVSKEGLNKWESILNSSFRKKITESFLKKINDKNIEIQGYKREKIISDLRLINNNKKQFFIRDILDYSSSTAIRVLKINLLKDKFKWARRVFLS